MSRESGLVILTVLVFGLFLSPGRPPKSEPSEPLVSGRVIAFSLSALFLVMAGRSVYSLWSIGEGIKKGNRIENQLERIRTSDDPEERAIAAYRLGKKGASEDVIKVLSEVYYNDPNIFVRQEALDALHRIDPKAIDDMFLEKSFEEARNAPLGPK